MQFRVLTRFNLLLSGGVMTDDGVMYTVPNNHKGVLRIQPANLQDHHKKTYLDTTGR